MAEREERLESRIIGTIQDLLKPKEEVKKYDPVEIPDIDEDLDEIPTKKDVLQLVRKMTEADKNKESQYWGRYSENLTTLAKGDKLNPEIIKAVAEELGQNMKNPVVHSDPAICAKLNYQAALINVLRKTPAKPEKKVPGSGEKTTVATGTITTQKTDRKPEPETNLDAESKRLARAFGLTDDKVKTILKKKEK